MATGQQRRMKQIPLAIAPTPQPTLDSFVPGANGAALAHLQGCALPSAPVYLWGPPGSGKSHLLRGLATRCQALGGTVGWFDAADAEPWAFDPAWSLLVVDRCDALCASAQHAAFVLFTQAAEHGVQFAAAGALPPVDLLLRDDLRSRLGWGHVFALQPLGEAETRSALRKEADRRGIFLSDEVMAYLLQRFPRDLAYLMHLLNCLDDYGLSRGRRITVPLVREMMAEDAVPDLSSP
jgi:DnaA family protein